jgi:uncharacterized protein YdeI (YjbR/CyaY-like superfamily)
VAKSIEKLYVTDRDKWRTWLKRNHKTKKEIWLIYYKKHTGKPRIPYDDAVEEALCFGWIDSTVKRLDDEKYIQKFTPRNTKSTWSELNIKRARKMIKEKKMTTPGLEKFNNAIKKKINKTEAKPQKKEIVIPSDLKKALTKNKKALGNFNNFAPSYKRMYIGWINSAKKQETKEKRIARVVAWSAKNQKPGML